MSQSKQPEPLKSTQMVKTHLAPLLIIAVIALGLLAGYWLLTRSSESYPNPLLHMGVGKTLEYCELLPLTGDGQPVSLDELKGRVVLLNFWGTWCPPCRRELPRIAELRKRYAGQQAFLLLAVSCPQSSKKDDLESLREETAGLLEREHIDLPTYYDPHSNTRNELSSLINSAEARRFAFPTTLLLDRDGVIRAVWVGYWSGMETEMERTIGMILDKESGPSGEIE